MPLTQEEKLLISAQMIKIHEGVITVEQEPLIHDVNIIIKSQTTHIEYSIALVETDDGQAIYVVFPGSNDRDDWMANFRFKLSEMIYKAPQPETMMSAQFLPSLSDIFKRISFVTPHAHKDGSDDWSDQQVHSGFMQAYYAIEHSIMRDLGNILKTYPTLDVYGVGHSLGSAIMRFTMLDAQFKKFFEGRSLPHLVTFGAPRMGNHNFAQSFAKRLPNIIRVVHGNDLVPRLPLPLLGYRHEIDEMPIGQKRFLRFYYRQDIRDHYMESYIARLEKMCRI